MRSVRVRSRHTGRGVSWSAVASSPKNLRLCRTAPKPGMMVVALLVLSRCHEFPHVLADGSLFIEAAFRHFSSLRYFPSSTPSSAFIGLAQNAVFLVSTMDNQDKSPFLCLPLEVRRAIYSELIPKAVHVFFQRGKVAVSRCVEPEVGGCLTGIERQPTEHESNDPDQSQWLWARRLNSSWGPHWRCEEMADIDRRTLSVLFVCKQM